MIADISGNGFVTSGVQQDFVGGVRQRLKGRLKESLVMIDGATQHRVVSIDFVRQRLKGSYVGDLMTLDGVRQCLNGLQQTLKHSV
jgi:hypothetical protein